MSAWTVVIPVKELRQAKSRLGTGITPPARAALARAFALDTIAAAVATPSVQRVVVVGAASELAALRELAGPELAGVEIVDERPGAGLSAAIRLGIEHARERDEPAVAVLLGDLPALTPAELGTALEAAARHPLAFVPDADGTGTTLATALAGEALLPQFGADSASRHVASGFTDLTAVVPDSVGTGLRRDVDTIEALEAVLTVGVGAHTAEAVAALADGSLPHDHASFAWTGTSNRKGTP